MSDEGEKTCPLCAEEMDMTDQQLKPCKCGYEICVWCWHHIIDMAEKDDSEGRCPACRSAYDKAKIVGMKANCGRLVSEGGVERKKSQKAKTKISDGRKQLSSVRVIQRNLVYIVGLPLSLADEDLLQSREYFGQYGKVLKVSMSRTTSGAVQQFPNNTCSVYITYAKEDEAIRCIQSVHGFVLDGKSLKACFGTTKYCHAWLRNVACTNPDCLYLHDVGSQEDSFTKDEIISSYTRNRVQQVTGATANMTRKVGNALPPPVDDYNTSASTPKPIVRSISNSSVTGKNSPPNGSTGRSPGLPAAASWGTRAPNLPQASGSSCLIGSPKLKPDLIHSTIATSAVASTSLINPLQSDKVKMSWDEDDQLVSVKGKLDHVKSTKSILDSHSTVTKKLSDNSDSLSTGICDFSISNVTSQINSNLCSVEWTGKEESLSNEQIQNPLSDSRGVISSHQELNNKKVSPSSYGDQDDIYESCSHSCAGLSSDRHGKIATDIEMEEDVISFDNQRLKDPEVISRPSYVGNPLHSRSRSLQHNNNAFKYTDGVVGDALHLRNGFSYSDGHLNNVDRSLHSSKSATLSGSNSLLDMGESSIITDMLSLDLDSWDDTLSSPRTLVKLLAESDKQSINLNCSTSRKIQSTSQSRFSFARQDGPANQSFNTNSAYNNTCQLPRNRLSSHDFADSSSSYTERIGGINGFSSNFGDSRALPSNYSPFTSFKSAVSRGQISAPPGFSIPSRPPPPGFSSQDRVEQNFDFFPGGNHMTDSLPRNSYQASSPGNICTSGDVEFIDPAILAVGKGRLEEPVNNPLFDVKSIFPQHFTYENDVRLQQLMMQRSLSNQNSRYTNDSFLSSRHLDQSQPHNLSPYPSNGHWSDWNQMQSGNTMAMAEMLRNERLGLNKLYGGNGYEDGKFRL